VIVICEECGKKYRFDTSKINEQQVVCKCNACGHQIIVEKSLGESEVAALELASFEVAVEDPSVFETIANSSITDTATKEGRRKKQASGYEMVTKKRFFSGMTAKVVTLMLFVSLIPLAIFSLITFQQTSTRILDDTNRFSQQVTSGLVGHVDEWVDKNVRALNAVAKMPDIMSMNQKRQEAVLKAVQQEYPWMYLVFTLDATGKNVARDDGKALTDYSDRQYYKDVMNGKALSWQTVIGRTSGKPALVIAVPIKSGGITIGVMASEMTIDAISENIASWRQGDTGYAFLVDETGKVVAHQVHDYVTQEKILSDHPLISGFETSPKDTLLYFKADGHDQIGHARQTKYGWILAIQQQRQEAFSLLRSAQFFALVLLSATIVMVCVIAYFSSRAIVTPIKTLTNAADRISIGELDVEIQATAKNEIGDLAAAISRMQDSLRLSIERLRCK